jgi:hypothetical protein
VRRHRLALCIVTLLGAGSSRDPPARTGVASSATPDGADADEGVDGVVVVRVASRDHVEGSVDYDTYPPAGGDHFPVWQNCGFYDAPVLDEMAVHALEHGAVWITYQESLPADQVATIEGLADDATHVLASPYPGLRAPVVVTAWERQLDLESTDDPRLVEFLDAYVEGPTTPEPGATCAGGADSTSE